MPPTDNEPTEQEIATVEQAAADVERRYQQRERALRTAAREADAALAHAEAELTNPPELYRAGDGPPAKVEGIATTEKLDRLLKAPEAWWNQTQRAGPPIERYVRCSVELPGGSIELGLLYNRGETLRGLSDKLGELATRAARVVDGPITLELAEVLSADLETMIVAQWGDRAWFLEVWNEDSALTQIYAPYGMPRRS